MRRGTRLLLASLFAAGCGGSGNGDVGNGQPCIGATDQTQLAYIVARDSDDISVIDLSCMQMVQTAKIGTMAAHMGELNANGTKFYVDSEETNETVVVRTLDLSVVNRIKTPLHPTHITLLRDGSKFAVMNEGAGTVSFIDPQQDQIVKVLDGFYLPHFARMSLDGKSAYVANLHANFITRVDLDTLTIADYIPLDGFQAPPNQVELDHEGGFADVQIDQVTGLLYGAHRDTGKVIVYDTNAQKKVTELQVGKQPWIVYAEHPFGNIARRHMVPNFADESASIIAAQAADPAVLATLNIADQESFGVNYSPLAPDRAFLMNRYKHQIQVVDTAKMQALDTIDVGGTTETASTSADGRYIVATVSSANKVVVIDAKTHQIVKSFDHVGTYPWSVTMLRGQNYCH